MKDVTKGEEKRKDDDDDDDESKASVKEKRRGIDATKAEPEIDGDLLDAITCQVMAIPMLLPSGTMAMTC